MGLELHQPESVGINKDALSRLVGQIKADTQTGQYDGAVILLARGGRVVCREAIGKSDLARNRDASCNDVFVVMSVAKAFTAAAILRAIDQGHLTLSTKVAEVIPEFGAKGKAEVTVRHLLTHTSGTWSNFFLPPPLSFDPDMRDLVKSVRAVCNLPLEFTAGEVCRYNPWASYAVLGVMLQRLDQKKRRFRDILAEDWFQPLGMNDTAFGYPHDSPRRVPIVLRESAEGAAERGLFDLLNRLTDVDCEHPAGGATSTVDDVFRFAEMWRNRGTFNGQRMLSPAMVNLALRNHTGDLTNRFWDYSKQMRGIPEFPANLTLAGGYIRGTGSHFSPLGELASPDAFCAVGGGSTMYMVDPVRELTFVFLSAGFLEGLNHLARLSRLNDLAQACIDD